MRRNRTLVAGLGLLAVMLNGCAVAALVALPDAGAAGDALGGQFETEPEIMLDMPLNVLDRAYGLGLESTELNYSSFVKWQDYEIGRRFEYGIGGLSKDLQCAAVYYASTLGNGANGLFVTYEFRPARQALDHLASEGIRYDASEYPRCAALKQSDLAHFNAA